MLYALVVNGFFVQADLNGLMWYLVRLFVFLGDLFHVGAGIAAFLLGDVEDDLGCIE